MRSDECANNFIRPEINANSEAASDEKIGEHGGGDLEAVSDDECGVCGEAYEDDVEHGKRETLRVQDPKEPSAEERENHMKTHLPYRSWCRHCVRGRGKQFPHRRSDDPPHGHEMHFYFCFLGREGEPHKTITILVAKDRATKMLMATSLPSKTTGTFTAKRVMAFIKECGSEFGDMVHKADQEEVLDKILKDVGRLRAAGGGGRFVPENSPVGASQSNGVIERGVQSVGGQTRVILDAVESKYGVVIPYSHPILFYIIEYAAFLLNRFEVGRDGKTAFERCKMKKSKVLGIEFGESVHWRRKKAGGALGKLSVAWEDGIFLGVRGRSGELIVADGKGVWKTRTVNRKPISERWDRASLDLVRHPPWRTSDADPEADGEMPEVIKLSSEEVKQDKEKMEVTVPRRVMIKKEDMKTFGHTAKCPGCMAAIRGAAKQGHSEACRKRFEGEMKDTEKATKAKRKFEDFMEEALTKTKANRTRATTDKKEEASGSGLTEEARERGREEVESQERRQGEKRTRDAGSDEEQALNSKKSFVGELEVNQEPDAYAFVGEFCTNQEDEDGDFEAQHLDDRSGEALDAKLVKKAEKEEIDYMTELGVGEESTREEARRMTGKAPTTTKFVRTNKGTKENPDVRARLCARDFRTGGDADIALFACMPPLEAKKILFRRAIVEGKKLVFIDVKKAHLNGKVPEDTFAYVELPDGRVWKLKRWLYGMRPAAAAWEADYSEHLEQAEFARGKSCPTVFFRKTTGCRCVVHGDDFTFMCAAEQVKAVIENMKAKYDIKVRGVLGGSENDDEKISILNRTVSWPRHARQITYQADEKHAINVMKEMGIEENSNGFEAPCEVENVIEDSVEDESELLTPVEAKKFRGLAAVVNYMSLDRMDTQFAAKEICRHMARPRTSSWLKLKRMARYLLQYPKLIWTFRGDVGDSAEIIKVFSDSDWAGCRRSRRSTSGGVASIGEGAVKHWSSTQGSTAMSSGEAEYYAMVKAAAEGLGIQSLCKDLGYDFPLRLCVDSTAAKAIASRLGLGKVRHMEVKYLWAQEAHKRGRFSIEKVWGTVNPADVLTKPQSMTEMKENLARVGAAANVRVIPAKPIQRVRAMWADVVDYESEEECE